MNGSALRWARDQLVSSKARKVLTILVLYMHDDTYVSKIGLTEMAKKHDFTLKETRALLEELYGLKLISPLFSLGNFNAEQPMYFFMTQAHKEAIWRSRQ